MTDPMDFLRWLFASIMAAIFALLASAGDAFRILLILIVIDLVTGLMAGFIERGLSSDIGWRGVGKKTLIILAVITASVIQPLAYGAPLSELVAGFYVANELVSIVENLSRVGVPIPPVLRDALVKLRAKDTGLAPGPPEK